MAQAPMTFSIPYRYDGLRVAGDPFYVQCVNQGMKHLDECSGLRLCVTTGTSHYEAIRNYLPERHIVHKGGVVAVDGGVYGGLIEGECNLLAAEGAFASYDYVASQVWNGSSVDMDNFEISQGYFSREPIAAITRTDDPEFSDFVNAILMAMEVAEQQNITQDTAHLLPQTTLFGEEYKNMFRDAVAYGGNYMEFYNKSTGQYQGRSKLDFLNNGSSGLLYPHPFGQIQNDRGDMPLGHTLFEILMRGQLHCGIPADQPGFATKEESGLSGMDVDFCRALSAALFGGDTDSVLFVEVEEDSDGYALLASEEIDVLAGATWTLETDVKEPTTGQGYTFSPPYFYGYSEAQGNFCLATRQDDPDFGLVLFTGW